MDDIVEVGMNTALENVVVHMNSLNPDTDEFQKSLNNLKGLNQALLERDLYLENKRSQHKSRKERFLENSALVNNATKLVATMMVLKNERLHVITSRAFGWIMRS